MLCFILQDALYKQYSGASPESRLIGIIEILKRFWSVLRKYQSEPLITIDYLEGVAGFRFAIMEIAGLLHASYVDNTLKKSQLEIFQLAEELCRDPVINSTDFSTNGEDVMGPAVYLLKLLVRQYGYPCLRHVSELYQWIIPEGLCTADQV